MISSFFIIVSLEIFGHLEIPFAEFKFFSLEYDQTPRNAHIIIQLKIRHTGAGTA